MCQQYALFAAGNGFFIYGMVIVQVCVGTVCGGGGGEGDKAAVGVWQREGRFQTVNKASQQNVTNPPVSHLHPW